MDENKIKKTVCNNQDTEQRQTKKNNNTKYYKDEHRESHQKNNSGKLGCSERVSNSCFWDFPHKNNKRARDFFFFFF
jgi:hypothetical protein